MAIYTVFPRGREAEETYAMPPTKHRENLIGLAGRTRGPKQLMTFPIIHDRLTDHDLHYSVPIPSANSSSFSRRAFCTACPREWLLKAINNTLTRLTISLRRSSQSESSSSE